MLSRFRGRLAPLLVILSAATPPAVAQLPPISVPKGLLRFTMDGNFGSYDHRFFNGQRQPLATDFTQERIGSNFFAALSSAEEILKRVTGLPNASLNIGSTKAIQQVTVGTAGIGLAYGLSRRLTIFGHIPITRVVVRASITLDSTGARSGFNPADPNFGDGIGAGFGATFFAQFDAALTQLDDALTSGAFDNDPNRKLLAQQTLGDGALLRADLFALLLDPTAPVFLPTATSAEGVALRNRVTGIQNLLSTSLGIGGFTLAPGLPQTGISDDQFQDFLTNPEGPIAGSLFTPHIFTLGDIELGAAYLLLDNRSETGEGLSITGEALARLPTSTLDRPELLFDVGTGERQPDGEFRLTADLVSRHFGIRVSGGYALQLSGNLRRRISTPSQPIAYANTLAAVTRKPGNMVMLGAEPFFRLTPTLALVGGARYASRGADRYDLFGTQDSIPNAPPSLLAEESSQKWFEVRGGLTYSSPHIPGGEERRMPMDAGVMLSTVAGGSGGRVPATVAVKAYLRLYTRFP